MNLLGSWKLERKFVYVQTCPWCQCEWSVWVFEANTPQTNCSVMSRVGRGCFPCFSPLCKTSLVPLDVVDLSLKPFCSECTNLLPLPSLSGYLFPSCVILERSSPLPSAMTFGHWIQILLQGVDRQHDRTSFSSRGNKDKDPPDRTKRRKPTWFKKPPSSHWLKRGLSRAFPGNALPFKQVEEHPCLADSYHTRLDLQMLYRQICYLHIS